MDMTHSTMPTLEKSLGLSKDGSGLSTPDYKKLVRAIVQSRTTVKQPEMGGKCEGENCCMIISSAVTYIICRMWWLLFDNIQLPFCAHPS